MADKTNRSSSTTDASAPNVQKQQQQSQSTSTPSNPYSSCQCTKIVITQLFYEMKQEFPTVPDHIVWHYATNNCHNREACIDGLRIQADEYPGSVNAYPAALRQQSNKKQTSTIRRPGNIPISPGPTVAALKKQTNEYTKSDKQTNNGSQSVPLQPQRPNTLNLGQPDVGMGGRPTRMAPPPPSCTTQQETFAIPVEQHADTPLNVSLNVIVSPVTGRPPLRPNRLAPPLGSSPSQELPHGYYNNNMADNHQHQHQHIHRSVQALSPGNFRSVSFTLHQPNSGGAGSYPNSGQQVFNETGAKIGYQSRLEISVGGNTGPGASGGTRLRPTNYFGMPELPTETNATMSREEAEIIQRQLRCKQRLEAELSKERKRLADLKRELLAIEAPIPPGGAKALSEEINQLRLDCSQMAKEVEEAGPSYRLGEINEAFYHNIYTGQRLPIQQRDVASGGSSDGNARVYQQPPPPIPAALRSNRPTATSPIASTSQQNPHYKNDDQLDASGGWTCKMCTFQNHPLLNKCEQCDMPLLSAGNANATGSLPPNGFIANDQTRVLQTGYVPMQYHQQPNRIHIPFQKQAAVTVGTVRSPIVYAYATPP